MTTAERLRAAAEHIRTYGFTPYAAGEHGKPCCPLGACYAVDNSALDDGAGECEVAIQALRRYLRESVISWAVKPGRRAAEAIEALEKAAEMAEEQEGAW